MGTGQVLPMYKISSDGMLKKSSFCLLARVNIPCLFGGGLGHIQKPQADANQSHGFLAFTLLGEN